MRFWSKFANRSKLMRPDATPFALLRPQIHTLMRFWNQFAKASLVRVSKASSSRLTPFLGMENSGSLCSLYPISRMAPCAARSVVLPIVLSFASSFCEVPAKHHVMSSACLPVRHEASCTTHPSHCHLHCSPSVTSQAVVGMLPISSRASHRHCCCNVIRLCCAAFCTLVHLTQCVVERNHALVAICV